MITKEHLKLLQNLQWRWNECAYGAPTVNPKRPYGNSSVALDMAEILDWKLFKDENDEEVFTIKQYKQAEKLHRDLLWVIPEIIEEYIEKRLENET